MSLQSRRAVCLTDPANLRCHARAALNDTAHLSENIPAFELIIINAANLSACHFDRMQWFARLLPGLFLALALLLPEQAAMAHGAGDNARVEVVMPDMGGAETHCPEAADRPCCPEGDCVDCPLCPTSSSWFLDEHGPVAVGLRQMTIPAFLWIPSQRPHEPAAHLRPGPRAPPLHPVVSKRATRVDHARRADLRITLVTLDKLQAWQGKSVVDLRATD